MNNSFIDLGNGYFLEHHGVLGMKWGIRRYQPYSVVPRGSGKGGREIGEARASKRQQRHNYKTIKRQLRNGQVDNLTDKLSKTSELKNYVKVLEENEKRYSKGSKKFLDEEPARRQYQDAAKKIVDDYLGKYGNKKISYTTLDGSKRNLSGEQLATTAAITVKNQKNRLLNNAKTKDSYSLDFLEAVQNKSIYNNRSKMLTEYKKYLDDPEKYWSEERHKLKDE